MRITESQLRRIVRQELRSLSEGIFTGGDAIDFAEEATAVLGGRERAKDFIDHVFDYSVEDAMASYPKAKVLAAKWKSVLSDREELTSAYDALVGSVFD